MSDIKLRKAILPLSLKESENKIIAMSKILSDFGTRTITLVHIKTGSNRKSQHIQEKLRSYAQRIKELNFDPEIKISHSNNITQGIYNTSYEVGAEFICIIWKAKGVIKKTLLGSKTIDTIRHINLPIFIFKQRNPLVKHCSLNSILYATDFKKTDSIVIPYLNNSEITASNLYFLHVRNRAPDPETEKLQLDAVNANMNRLKEECKNFFQNIKTIQVIGSPKKQIVRQARKNNVDLILIGKSDTPNPMEQIMGSTAEAIPFKSSCSVFIIPSKT